MTYVRTSEHRQALAKRNRTHKPWRKSTGPKTEDGKRRSARNAYKGGVRPMMRKIAKALREQSEYETMVAESIGN